MATEFIDQQTVGSVGSLVGAAMETAGHYMQSSMLDAFDSQLAKPLGVFLYVLTATIVVLSWVMTGNFKAALWLVLGPSLFWFMISTRTVSSGAQWRWGFRGYSQQAVADAANGVVALPADQQMQDKNVRVSWFFKVWDRIVSGSVQTFVSAVELVNKRGNERFGTLMKKYLGLYRLEIQDDKLKYFMDVAIVNHCGPYYSMKREYYNAAENYYRRPELQKKIEVYGKTMSSLTGPDAQMFIQWVMSSGVWTSDLKDAVVKAGDSTQFSTEQKATLDALKLDSSIVSKFNCEQLWQILFKAVLSHAVALYDEMAEENLPAGLSEEERLTAKAETKAQLESKFTQRVNRADGSISEEKNDEKKALLLINELSARMVLKELSKINPNLAQMQYGRDISYQSGELSTSPADAAKSLRVMQRTDEYEEKADYLMTAMALPYVQGMLLFFLAMTFPFFALTLIIPGKHTTILTWCGLWIWAKSWDVGIALVMVIDQIMFYLFPHGPPISEDVKNDPGMALKSLLEVDPTYSVHVYYNLMSTALAAVPIVTAMLVKKGGGEIADLVAGHMNEFSGRVGTVMGTMERAAKAQDDFAQVAMDANDAGRRAMSATVGGDSVFASSFMGSILGQVATNLAHMPDGAGKFLNGAVKQAVKDFGEHQAAIMDARMSTNVATALYNEGTSKTQLSRNYEAVRLRYNSHDFYNFGNAYPWEQQLSQKLAEEVVSLNKSGEKAWSGTYDAVIEQLNKMPDGAKVVPVFAMGAALLNPDSAQAGTQTGASSGAPQSNAASGGTETKK